MDGVADWTGGGKNDGSLADWMWGNANGMATERRMHGLRVCRGGRGKERGGEKADGRELADGEHGGSRHTWREEDGGGWSMLPPKLYLVFFIK